MKLPKIDTTSLKDKPGIVYVAEFTLDDKQLVKIGVTTRDNVEDRITEILTAMWKRYRYFPRCYVKRFKKVNRPYAMERELHSIFNDKHCNMEYNFSGSCEFFEIDKEEVAKVYDEIIDKYR